MADPAFRDAWCRGSHRAAVGIGCRRGSRSSAMRDPLSRREQKVTHGHVVNWIDTEITNLALVWVRIPPWPPYSTARYLGRCLGLLIRVRGFESFAGHHCARQRIWRLAFEAGMRGPTPCGRASAVDARADISDSNSGSPGAMPGPRTSFLTG
jgi:hypothetical protein